MTGQPGLVDPLSASRPQDLVRLAAVLGQTADQVDAATHSARRSEAVTWDSPGGASYQRRLAHLCGRLERTSRSYAEAAQVLLAYSRAMASARELALKADALDATATDLQRRARPFLGSGRPDIALPDIALLDQAGGVRARARHVREQANLLDDDAGGRAAGVLNALATEAPHEAASVAAGRMIDDLGQGLAAQVDGVVALGRALWSSLPGVGRDDQRALARHQALEAAQQALQPWLLVEQVLHDLQDGRVGRAAGVVAGAALTRRVPLLGKDGVPRFAGHQHAPGYLAGLPQGALQIADQAEAWARAHEAKALQDDVAVLRLQATATGRSVVPADWLDHPVDLRHHEASGGHTLLKHVDARVELLQWRLRLEQQGALKSSFADLDEAVSSVQHVLDLNRLAVESFMASTRSSQIFRAPASAPTGVVLRRSGETSPGSRLRVTLRRHQDGSVYIVTAMVDL